MSASGEPVRAVTAVVRFALQDYVRNPVNLLLLLVVPTVFVLVVAPTLAGVESFTGGLSGPPVEVASAAWSATFLAGVAMYFQVVSTGDADRRLLSAGLSGRVLTGARLATGFVLAAAASGAAVLTLLLRADVNAPARVLIGTLVAATMYVGIGAAVGAVVPNPVNGTVVLMFLWLFDVFFGPVMTADRPLSRVLPTHFAQLWVVDLESGHAARLSDLSWALVALTAALGLAFVVVRRRASLPGPRRAGRPWSATAQFDAAMRAVRREARRNPVQWVLYAVVPAVFVIAADAVTPEEPLDVLVREGGAATLRTVTMPAVHATAMAAIAVAALSALAGLFGVLESRRADGRVTLAGLRPGALLVARLVVLVASTLVALTVTLVATGAVTDVRQWVPYGLAVLGAGMTYGLVGSLIAPLTGRVAGVFLVFLLPFLDLGIAQSPLLRPEPSEAATWLPGYGASRVALDAALTSGFDEGRGVLLALVWLAVLLALVAVVYRHSVRPKTPVLGADPQSRSRTGS